MAQERLLYIGMTYDYGDRSRGYSYEHRNFYHSLQAFAVAAGWDFASYDFMTRGQMLGTAAMTEELLQTAERLKPTVIFAVLFEFGHDPIHDVFPIIAARTGATTVHWFCDDHWRFERYSAQVAPYFNFVTTTASSALPKYGSIGLGDRVIKTQWASNHLLYTPLAQHRDIAVSFVGQPHGNRAAVIADLQSRGVPVEVFGFGWPNRPRLPFHQMVRLFSRSKVNLNLSNSSTMVGQQIKGRNFEIPATGGLQLSGAADNLSDYFIPGEEIVIAESSDAFVAETQRLVADDQAREKIAAAGYRRVQAEHTWFHRWQEIFARVGHRADVPLPRLDDVPVVVETAEPTPQNTVGVEVSVVLCGSDASASDYQRTAQSLARQSYPDFEIIVADTAPQFDGGPRVRRVPVTQTDFGGIINEVAAAAYGRYLLPLVAGRELDRHAILSLVSAARVGDSDAVWYAHPAPATLGYTAVKHRRRDLLAEYALVPRGIWEAIGGYPTNLPPEVSHWSWWIKAQTLGIEPSFSDSLLVLESTEQKGLGLSDRSQAGLPYLIAEYPLVYTAWERLEVGVSAQSPEAARSLLLVAECRRIEGEFEQYALDMAFALTERGYSVTLVYAFLPRLTDRTEVSESRDLFGRDGPTIRVLDAANLGATLEALVVETGATNVVGLGAAHSPIVPPIADLATEVRKVFVMTGGKLFPVQQAYLRERGITVVEPVLGAEIEGSTVADARTVFNLPLGVPFAVVPAEITPRSRLLSELEAFAAIGNVLPVLFTGMRDERAEAYGDSFIAEIQNIPGLYCRELLDRAARALSYEDAACVLIPNIGAEAQLAAIRAMGYGMPWFAVPQPNLENFRGGITAPIAAWARSLRTILGNDNTRKELVRSGADAYRALGTFARVVDHIEEILTKPFVARAVVTSTRVDLNASLGVLG